MKDSVIKIDDGEIDLFAWLWLMDALTWGVKIKCEIIDFVGKMVKLRWVCQYLFLIVILEISGIIEDCSYYLLEMAYTSPFLSKWLV